VHFALALSIAVSFWGARGVHPTCNPVPVSISSADARLPHDRFGNPDAMGAEVATCRILISGDGAWLRHSRGMAPLYCADVVHEVGHIGGLSHTPTGLMAEHAIDDDDIPWDCYHWRTYARRHGIALHR
jgi:hypothetical protein